LVFSAISESAAASKVHLHRNGAPQRVDHFDEPQPARLGGNFFGLPCDKVERAQIGVKSPFDSGPQHFYGNRPRLARRSDFRFVDLGDGGRGNRGSKALKNRIERAAERGLHRRLRFLLRKRRHPVLQLFEIAGECRTDDVGPRCQKLSKLDVTRTQSRHRRREPCLRCRR
jgi:hypothetical protein